MIEKRRHPRHVVLGMGIHAKTIFNTEAEILDISTSGASIRCQKRLNMGDEYTFKFEHRDGVISIQGVVVWETLSGIEKNAAGVSIPVYTLGIEFREALTDKAQQFRDFVADTFEELREQSLCGIGLKIHDLEKVVLSRLETHTVRDISLGGIRIETEQDVPLETVFYLELILKEHEEPICCKGRVAFSFEVPRKRPKRYGEGVEFMDMVEADMVRLKQFVDSLPQDGRDT